MAKRITKDWVGEGFCNRRKRFEMERVILTRNHEQKNEMHGRVVESLEVNAARGSPENGHNLINFIGKGMGNGHSGSDASAHHGFPCAQRLKGAFAQGCRNLPGMNQMINEFDNRGPMLYRLKFEDEVILIEQIGQFHDRDFNNSALRLACWE